MQKFFFNGVIVAGENFLHNNSISLGMFPRHKYRLLTTCYKNHWKVCKIEKEEKLIGMIIIVYVLL